MVAPGAMVEQLAAEPASAALLFDFDGSLAPIVVDPAAAAAPPETLAVLGRLADALGLVGIVSGRPVEFLARAVPLAGVELVGQYGLERRVGTAVVVDPAARPYREAVATALAEARRRWPDLLVEAKGEIAVTVHWRAQGDAGESVAADVEALGEGLGLAVHPTRRARELRPPLPVDKGSAVRTLVAEARAVTRCAFAGDDRGDLPAFDALDLLAEHGRLDRIIRIAVRSSEAPGELIEAADLVVDGPEGLVEWMRAVADAVGSA